MLKSTQVKNAKPKDKPYKLNDGAGLYLFVGKSGTKSWRFDYRFDGLRKTETLGRYPKMSLEQARLECLSLREKLADGIPISSARNRSTIRTVRSNSPTFSEIAEEVINLKREAKLAKNTVTQWEYYLRTLAGAEFGSNPIDSIQPLDVLAFQRKLRADGRGVVAFNVLGKMSAVFRHAIIGGFIISDPCAPIRGIVGRPAVVHRAALKNEKELTKYLERRTQVNADPIILLALDFLLISMARPIEVRQMTFDEVDYEEAAWIIPGEKMKMGRTHMVPLLAPHKKIIQKARLIGDPGNLVFPSPTRGREMIGKNTFRRVIERMGYSQDELVPHGFRSTASTILNEAGFRGDAIERQLAHKDTDVIRGTYNRAAYWEERIEMMQYWCDLIESLKN